MAHPAYKQTLIQGKFFLTLWEKIIVSGTLEWYFSNINVLMYYLVMLLKYRFRSSLSGLGPEIWCI